MTKMMKEGYDDEDDDDYEDEIINDLDDGGLEDELLGEDEPVDEADPTVSRFTGENVEDEDWDHIFDSGLEEDPYFETPLDPIDPRIKAKELFSSMSADAQNYILQNLNAAQQAQLQKLLSN